MNNNPASKVRNIPSAHQLASISEQMIKASDLLKRYYGGDHSDDVVLGLDRCYRALEYVFDDVQASVIELFMEMDKIINLSERR